MLEMHHLFNNKNIIILNEVTRLIFEIRNGSLKINSSIMGNTRVNFKKLIGVNISSLREGNKLKYLKGVVTIIPVIMSMNKIIRNDFNTNFRKE
jgi:hypothetical protein